MTNTNVLEQSVDIRNVAEERNSGFGSTFGHPFDTAHQDRSTIRHTDHRIDGREREHRQLNRNTLRGRFKFIVADCYRSIAIDGIQQVIEHRIGRPLSRRSTIERERLNIRDLTEERHQVESNKSAIVGNDGLHVQVGSIRQDRDDGLVGDCKIADDWNHRGYERPAGTVADTGTLTIEHGHGRSLHDVRTLIAFTGLNQEEDFDIGQDRETKIGGRCQIKSTKQRLRRCKTTLQKLQIEITAST